MTDCVRFYIDGRWVDAGARRMRDIVSPATESVIGRVALGSAADVDAAVTAARRAFGEGLHRSREERLALLDAILAAYQARAADLAAAVTAEMGAPAWLAAQAHVPMGAGHIVATRVALEKLALEEPRGSTLLRREPVGVCALITPWNWPLNQVACKVLPAIAAGCTMVLKPSEYSAPSAQVFAEILHEAGVPPGVFNLVHGEGHEVGSALAAHPGVDMVSFTGSTRAGILVAKSAADTVKRVSQELGGKSPNIILDDADLPAAVAAGVQNVMINSGQSCNAATRMLVPSARHDEALAVAAATVAAMPVGDPGAAGTVIGPVVNGAQFERIQRLIAEGLAAGATLACGGPGRPEGMARGWYVRPTVFGNVRNDMAIAREEIFGPVLCVIPYDGDAQAIEIANDTVYGLSAQVWGQDPQRVNRVVEALRAGMVHVNGAGIDLAAPFGGYKQSGNGREWGDFGLHEFLEVKAVMRPADAGAR